MVVVLLTELKSKRNSIWNNNNDNPIRCNDDGRNNNSNKSLIIIFIIIHKLLILIWDTSSHLVQFVLHFSESNIPTWVFLKLDKWYRIAQSIIGFRQTGKLRELANTSRKSRKSWKLREFCWGHYFHYFKRLIRISYVLTTFSDHFLYLFS